MPNIFLNMNNGNKEIFYDKFISATETFVTVMDNETKIPIAVPIASIAYMQLPKDYIKKND